MCTTKARIRTILDGPFANDIIRECIMHFKGLTQWRVMLTMMNRCVFQAPYVLHRGKNTCMIKFKRESLPVHVWNIKIEGNWAEFGSRSDLNSCSDRHTNRLGFQRIEDDQSQFMASSFVSIKYKEYWRYRYGFVGQVIVQIGDCINARHQNPWRRHTGRRNKPVHRQTDPFQPFSTQYEWEHCAWCWCVILS